MPDHVVVQCFALRNTNIWNVRFYLRQLHRKCTYLIMSDMGMRYIHYIIKERLYKNDKTFYTNTSVLNCRLELLTFCISELYVLHEWIQMGGGGARDPNSSPGQSQVSIGFFRNAGTDTLEKPLDPLCLLAF